MEVTTLKWYADKYLRPVAQQWPTRVNDSKKAVTYLFKSMLTRKMSGTMAWKSFWGDTQIVAADYVARGSQLPIKQRDKIEAFTGKIPKVGMKKHMTEEEENDLMILEASGADEATLAREITNDVEAVISGVWEANEDTFLRLLYNGEAVINDESRPGLGLRLTLNIKDDNQLYAATTWEGTTAAVADDIEEVITHAEELGDSLVAFACTKTMLDFMRRTEQGRAMYARANAIFYTDIDHIAAPSRTRFADAMQAEYGLKWVDTTRTIRYEKNGEVTKVKPFGDDRITFLTTEQVGTLWYADTVESKKRSSIPSYATSDDYILVSQHRDIEPYLEVTRSQAMVLPMLDDISSIYWFSSTAKS